MTAKFSGAISADTHRSFPDEYFTCMSQCSSCDHRCTKAINHEAAHHSAAVCIFQKKLENKVYLCMK